MLAVTYMSLRLSGLIATWVESRRNRRGRDQGRRSRLLKVAGQFLARVLVVPWYQDSPVGGVDSGDPWHLLVVVTLVADDVQVAGSWRACLR